MQVSREAEKRINQTSECEQKVVSHEQAAHGRKRSPPETSVATGVREWIYAATAAHGMLFFFFYKLVFSIYCVLIPFGQCCHYLFRFASFVTVVCSRSFGTLKNSFCESAFATVLLFFSLSLTWPKNFSSPITFSHLLQTPMEVVSRLSRRHLSNLSETLITLLGTPSYPSSLYRLMHIQQFLLTLVTFHSSLLLYYFTKSNCLLLQTPLNCRRNLGRVPFQGYRNCCRLGPNAWDEGLIHRKTTLFYLVTDLFKLKFPDPSML